MRPRGGLERGGYHGRLIGRTKEGWTPSSTSPADAKERPMRVFQSAGKRSDCVGSEPLLFSLLWAKVLIADRARDQLDPQASPGAGTTPCISSR